MHIPDAETLCRQLAEQIRPHVTADTALVGIHTGGLWLAERLHALLGIRKPLGAIDPAKLNVVGSSLAFGHPFAATGARIVATAAKLLDEKGGGRALISVCTAGGMGVVAIVER